MADVRLRPSTEDDVQALAAILAEPSVLRWWGANDADDVREDLVRAGALAIEVDGRLSGALLVDEEQDPDCRHAAFDIFLSAAIQDRGVGPRALRIAIDRLVADGHHRFTIDPGADNERAIRSYAKLGFRPVGTLRRAERRDDGTWNDVLLMELLADELLQ